MSLFKYFKKAGLPTAEDAGISAKATESANAAVSELLQCQLSAPSSARKRKRYISFTDEERVQIGQFAAENGNNAALKKFKSSFPDL